MLQQFWRMATSYQVNLKVQFTRLPVPLLGARCNGWTNWEYVSKESGERESIDFLRKKAERITTRVKILRSSLQLLLGKCLLV